MVWKKGQSGNPKGRYRIISPEIEAEIHRNKRAVKTLILECFNRTNAEVEARLKQADVPQIERVISSCLTMTQLEGDVDKLRKLLEIVFGRIPEDKDPFELSPEEKLMVMTFRQKLEQQNGTAPAIEDGREDD